MRIGMMADTYKPHVSGITNYIDLNKRSLEQAGHDVYVFTFGDLDHEDTETNIVRSPGLPLVDTGYYLSFNYSREAKKLLQSMDVVHVHHPFLSGRLALRYCRPLHIPIVFTNHTRYDLYAQAYLGISEELTDSLLQTYMPHFCQAVNLVVSPSNGMAGVLKDLGVKSSIEVIPNGVELRHFHQAQPLDRADFGFSPKDILLVYVGRLAPEKNLDFLIRAFAGVSQAVDNLRLLVVGSGPEEENLRKLANKFSCKTCIHFTGMVEYDRLPAYLAMCDTFITASVTEVHPLSVIEAMGAGLPVMGIDSPGVGDTIVDKQTGFLSTHDMAGFSAKLTRLCLDQDLRKKMSVAARQASSQYAIERTTQLMLDWYERLVHEAQPRQRDWQVRLRGVWERYR
jgi:1,2-diacylglycerol 3-alpha-glucosyltransferase